MCIQYMWSLYFVYAIAEMETPCDRRERQGHQCCPGSFFNLTVQECQVCPAGYTGLNCSDICLPGLYGMECQIKCPLECSVTCDHTTGICPDQRDNDLPYLSGYDRKRELTGSCPSHGSHTSYFDTGDIFF
ncbi:multiple epidermal growth factor-like domains protein 10 isoform X4 [Ostrea edulis]|uniref:multiple epidermal growth factor-like domains protein 10 isoform X4 n=1 Tax=Ostrea edulis TaxID=37623 RepID=UPI0024AFC2C2|nr:multiple epidermal growth factor-like domains protein 10 isoform X4 [Ostrea edulis]